MQLLLRALFLFLRQTSFFILPPIWEVGRRHGMQTQSDFFRVVHTLDEAEIARTLEVACSRGLEGALDRRRIARWAKSQFPSPESMAGEINRIYNDVTDQLRGSISALAEDGPGGGSAGSARAWTTPSSGGGVAPTNSKRP